MTGSAIASAGAAKQRSRWKVWGKWVLVALGVLVLAVVGSVAWNLNKPRVCPVVAPGPTGERIQTESIFANYFPGRGKGRRPAVIVIGGYDGGLGGEARREALALQEAGFSALQVAHHCAETLPNKMSRLPLERFSEAIDWLKARPELDPRRIGIVGYSKGAEAARACRPPSGYSGSGRRYAVLRHLGRDEPDEHDFRRYAIDMDRERQ